MPIVRVARGQHFQAEIPDSVKDRSVKGSLHFSANSIKEITADELTYIREKIPHASKLLTDVTAAPSPAKAPEKAAEKPAADEANASEANAGAAAKGDTGAAKKSR